MNSRIAAAVLCCLTCSHVAADVEKQLAFPTAEGFGRITKGGRGGKIYKVTNLNDSGPGSLREAVEAEGPRIVVFDVDGTLRLNSPLQIQHDFITIAGQSAPGGGITVSQQPGAMSRR